MGRRRLYDTAEAKNAANKAKSKKHYEKNKSSINKKRRKEYSREHQSKRESETTPVSKESQPTVSVASPLASWMDCVDRLSRNLKREVGASPQEYVEGICSAFLEHQDKDQILEKVVKLSKLQTRVYRYENEIYALAGVGPEYVKATQLTKEVLLVIKWTEEILCYAMVDFKEVQERYVGGEFMYQSK